MSDVEKCKIFIEKEIKKNFCFILSTPKITFFFIISAIARRSCDQYAVCYRLLKKTIDQTLKSSAYSIVNLTNLFSGFMNIKM